MVAVASCSTTNDVTSTISCADVKDWLQKTPVQSGEIWFVICARWFSNFIGQFDELSDTQFSPKKCGKLTPIDNSELFDDRGSIRRDLILDMDYRIIPQECWERLVHEYKIKKGQEPLPVSIIQDGDALGPELYCYEVTLKEKYSDKEVVKSVSRTTTLSEIEKMMRKQFNIPPGLEARLELQPMADCEWVHIEDKSVSLMDTGATESSVIVIDAPERRALAIPNGRGPYYNCHEMDGIRVTPAGPTSDLPSPVDPPSAMNGSQPMEDNGIASSQHSSMASPPSPSLATSSAASPAELLDRVIGEDEASGSALPDAEPGIGNSGDSGISSVPSTGPADAAVGPSTLQEHLEQEARFDISSVGSGMISVPQANEPESSSSAVINGAIALPYEPLQPGSSSSSTSMAIPLPYGPVNQPDSGAIALPYGPATQADSTSMNALAEEEPSEPGVCGLRNLVNTCYMNSALQCLSNVKPLTQFFLLGEWEKDINLENGLGMQGRLARAFADLMAKIWSGKYKSITPSEMKDMVGQKDKQFLGSRQHDSQELMSAVLDGLHEDLKLNSVAPSPSDEVDESAPDRSIEVIAEAAKRRHRQRQNSRIVDLVYGSQKSTVVCNNCSNVSVTFDPFNVLSLPLPGGNMCRLDVTFVALARPEQKPVRHSVEVISTGTVATLLGKVAEVARADVSRLWAAELCNYRVNQPLRPSLAILSVIDMFNIYVYERPPAACKEGDDDAMDECSMVEPEGAPPVSENGDVGPRENGVEEDAEASIPQPVVINMVDGLYSLPFGQPVVFFPESSPAAVSVEELSEVVLRQGVRYITPPSEEEVADRWWEDRPYGPLPTPAPLPSPPAALPTAASTSSLPDLRPTPSADDGSGANGAGPMEQEEEEEQADKAKESEERRSPVPPPPPPMFTLSRIDDEGNRHEIDPSASVDVPGNKMVRLVATWHRRARPKFYRESEANSLRYASNTTLSSCPKRTTLSHCLDLLTSEDLLEGSNAVECTKCPRTADGRVARCAAKKKIDLWDLPPVLILHLKRFMYMTHTSKLEIPVEFPVSDLCLDQWVKGPQPAGVYDLVAVSNHSSHYLDRGHYTTFARNWQNAKWYRFDDDYVTETEPKLDEELAYILVYVRRDEDRTSEMGADSSSEDMDIA